MKKLTAIIIALIMLMSFAACSGDKTTNTDADSSAAGTTSEAPQKKVSFTFTVVDVDGNEKDFTVETDKKTVGEALIDEGLIAGEDGPYGLYVKTVDGKTLDYDKDGKYWAFYVNGELSATGVDMTDVTEGAAYSFKAE